MTQPDARGKTWLGHMETLYAGLTWHIFPMPTYSGAAVRSPGLFPPLASLPLTVAPSPQTITMEPDLHRYASDGVSAWMTDIERSTGFQPKLYGFDLGRVTETWDDTGSSDYRRVSPSEPPATRGAKYCQSEYELMIDLMVGVWRNDGEIFAGHSIFNPFVGTVPAANVNLTNYSNLIRDVKKAHDELGVPIEEWRQHVRLENVVLGTSGTIADWSIDPAVGSTDIGKTNDALRLGIEILEAKCTSAGRLFARVLATLAPEGKAIYYRPLHEPNTKFFWWADTDTIKLTNPGTGAHRYYAAYRRLYRTCCEAVIDGLQREYSALLANDPELPEMTPEELRARIKFVMNLNGITEPYTPQPSGNVDADRFAANATLIDRRRDEMKRDLAKFLNAASASAIAASTLGDLSGFVDILSLDYYEDNLNLTAPSAPPGGANVGGTPYLPRTGPTTTTSQPFAPSNSALYTQYLEVARAAKRLGVEHALAEVGLRAQYRGKMYGHYEDDQGRVADVWPSADSRFFTSTIRQAIELPGGTLPPASAADPPRPDPASLAIDRPKWVMFWTNRVENSVLEGPVLNGGNPATPAVSGQYLMNPFTDHTIEFFTPSFKWGGAGGGYTIGSVSVSVTPPLGIGGLGPFHTQNVDAYNLATTDFYLFVTTAVRAGVLEVL